MFGLTEWLDKTLYGDYGANWDDERLREAILRHLRSHMVVLDVGAGTGRVKQMNFRGVVKWVVGVDPDPRVSRNPFLDEAHVALADRLPFQNEQFDVVFSDNVLEHLDSPQNVLLEIARVLKPGGYFIAKTPNRFHYMTLVARVTPTWFHRLVNKLRGRPYADTFPTRYRINSVAAVRHFADECGLQVAAIKLLEGRPEYLRFNPLTYLFGWLYERTVNSTEWLEAFRVVLLIELQKPAQR